jgi:hypothetical protein
MAACSYSCMQLHLHCLLLWCLHVGVCTYSVYKHTAPTFSDRLQSSTIDLLFCSTHHADKKQKESTGAVPNSRQKLRRQLLSQPISNSKSFRRRILVREECDATLSRSIKWFILQQYLSPKSTYFWSLTKVRIHGSCALF